jgi:predicted transposase/invertase (TIGR01784 family)
VDLNKYLNTLPEDYLEKLKLNVPEHLLKLMADYIKLFLIKAEIEEEKIDVITEKLYARRFNDMFDVQFSFREIAQKERLEGKLEAVREMARKLLRKNMPVKDISEITGLDDEVIVKLRSDIDGAAVV